MSIHNEKMYNDVFEEWLKVLIEIGLIIKGKLYTI